jgi:hypothetical protein
MTLIVFSLDISLQEFITATEYEPASVLDNDAIFNMESVIDKVVPFFFHIYEVIVPPVPVADTLNGFPTHNAVSLLNARLATGLGITEIVAEELVIGLPQ